MKSIRRVFLAQAALAWLVAPMQLIAADPPKATVMEVNHMCSVCVKNITARLEKMPGIAKIQCDTARKSVTVTPVPGKEPSARALWDAMAEIGKTPTKLSGPAGTFTSRPQE